MRDLYHHMCNTSTLLAWFPPYWLSCEVPPLYYCSLHSINVLVICDYATRYPAAIPLCCTDAHRVAEELIVFFSRVEIPREILSDRVVRPFYAPAACQCSDYKRRLSGYTRLTTP